MDGEYNERARVFAAVSAERDHQDSRWRDSEKSEMEYVLMIEQYAAEARAALTHPTDDNGSTPGDCIRKITALGVACMEENGIVERVMGRPCET